MSKRAAESSSSPSALKNLSRENGAAGPSVDEMGAFEDQYGDEYSSEDEVFEAGVDGEDPALSAKACQGRGLGTRPHGVPHAAPHEREVAVPELRRAARRPGGGEEELPAYRVHGGGDAGGEGEGERDNHDEAEWAAAGLGPFWHTRKGEVLI